MWEWLTKLFKENSMATFTGGTPTVTFNNDDLVRLGQAIAASAGSGEKPPTGPTASPPGGTTVSIDVPWAGGRTPVPMMYEDVAVLHFRTPSGELLSPGNIAWTELNPPGPPCQRYVTLSTTPKNFSTAIAGLSGQSGEFSFIVTTSAMQPWVYPLLPDHDYYLNISNQNGSPGQNCTMAVDFRPAV